MHDRPLTLWQVLDRFRPSEILGWDLFARLAFAGGAVYMAASGNGGRLVKAAPVAVSLAGVTVAAVVAALALMASFMSPQFLRNLSSIGREPTRYIAPFLATVVLGIFGSTAGLVLAVLDRKTDSGLLGVVGAVTALFTVWAVGSLIRALSTLVQFVQLQQASAAVPDEDSTR